LEEVACPVVEAGPGFTRLRAVRERPPGGGPLLAVCAGATELAARGHAGAVLVVACDLPFVTQATLAALACHPGEQSLVPLVGGRWQPLCARWSAADLALAHNLAEAGARSMRALVEQTAVTAFGPGQWPPTVHERHFADVDTPEDASVHGLVPRAAAPVGGPVRGSDGAVAP
ncbi:MAG TPA: NTP transferase domain-containing protein, partial [Acidimicrobiales bacterium]|nr:NTP transferase domain-containing protein [Acidimicrobiales bacterium]